MGIRARKFVGTLLLLMLVTAWALLAMALAQFVLPRDNAWLSFGYYALAGLGWVLPAMPLIRWMQGSPGAGEP